MNEVAWESAKAGTHDEVKTLAQGLRAPRTVSEVDVPQGLLEDLCIRLLFRNGRRRLGEIAAQLCLPPSVARELLGALRGRQLVEVAGHRGLEIEADYQLTAAGQDFAAGAFNRCQYVGPAPVSLAAYCVQAEYAAMRNHTLNAAYVHKALRGLVVAPMVLDQLGAAMNSGRAVLIFGPAGSGKTYLAEHLAALQPGSIPVPHAITVGGEIVQIFDPLIHEPMPSAKVTNPVRPDCDLRWQWCRRPVVVSGGELTLQMLDLQFDPATRYYQAPPHIKANGGVYVVDDLGRQLVAPRDLMNRWIVPLDRHRDYLTLHTGFKFMVPFEVATIFSTNLKPADIADEAFLRRFGYKIPLGPMTTAAYRRVFEACCRNLGVGFDPEGFAWLIEHRHRKERRELLACYPRDLVGRVRDFALYHGYPARATPDALATAWSTYFSATGEAAADDIDVSNNHGGLQ